jgi:hypothetical protein
MPPTREKTPAQRPINSKTRQVPPRVRRRRTGRTFAASGRTMSPGSEHASNKKTHQLAADDAAMNADMAEACVLDAIDFVQAAMDEAESAALDAISAREPPPTR